LSSEITRGVPFFNIYRKYHFLTGNIFIRVIKAYSLEDQHQNNMVSLAKESKSKSLSLAKAVLIWAIDVGSYWN
jgi:ATP-binding cassette subfamily B protein